MKTLLIAILFLVLLVIAPLPFRNHGKLLASQLQQSAAPADLDRLVSAFTAKETVFRDARAQYSYKRDAVFQTIGAGGQISGVYHRTSQLLVDDSGKRIEKILFFPTPTLSGIGIATEDLEDLGGVPLFALEATKAPFYNFKYSGKERIDELDLHVFDVSPKTSPDPKKTERFFQGRVWVDIEGQQIVKTRGKGVPEKKTNPYPTVETYREEIDGHWFPTYAEAKEELVLANGQAVGFRMRVSFSEFKKVNRK